MENGNVRGAEVQRIVVVTSLIGEGTDQSPMREIIEYYSLDGQFLARRDTWMNEKEPEPTSTPYSQDAWKIVEYVTRLLSNEEISAPDGENAYSIALRVWKEEHDTVKEFDRLISFAKSAKQWTGLKDKWEACDIPSNAGEEPFDSYPRCCFCAEVKVRNENKLCFECWEKLVIVKRFIE